MVQAGTVGYIKVLCCPIMYRWIYWGTMLYNQAIWVILSYRDLTAGIIYYIYGISGYCVIEPGTDADHTLPL